MAAGPLGHWWGSISQEVSAASRMRRLVGWSSTMRVFRPRTLASPSRSRDMRRVARRHRAVKWNVLPTPTSLSRLRGGVSTGVRAGKAKTAEKAFQAMDAYIRG